MAVYTIFDSTNMKTTKYAERIMDVVATEDIENGTFGYIDELDEDGGVIYKFHKGTKTGAVIVVADNPAHNDDTSLTSNQARRKYINKANTPFRARVVAKNDEFAISIDGVTSSTQSLCKPNAYVTIDTSGKLKASATTTADADMEGKVMRKRISGATVCATNADYGYKADMYEIKITTLA